MILLPIEIINKILEYNPDHRSKLKLSFHQLKIQACLQRLGYIYYIWTRDQKHEFHFYLYLKLNIQDPEYLIHYLSQCNCCYRHSILRPSCLNCLEYLQYTHGQAPKEKEILGCMCPCRYYCRILHHAFD